MNTQHTHLAIDLVERSETNICLTDKNLEVQATSPAWKSIFEKQFRSTSLHILTDLQDILKNALNGSLSNTLVTPDYFENNPKIKLLWNAFPYFEQQEIAGIFVSFENVIKQPGDGWARTINGPGNQTPEHLYLPEKYSGIPKETALQEALSASDQRFSDAFNYSAIGMALISPSGRWIEVNRKVCEILGYEKEELQTLSFQDLSHPEDLSADLALMEDLVAGKIPSYQMEKRYFHKSGKIIWALLAVSMVRDKSGQLMHFVSQIEDITNHKAAITQLRESENRFRTLFELSPVGFTLNELDTGRFIELNQAILTDTGYTRADFLNFTYWDLISEDYKELEIDFFRSLHDTGFFGPLEVEYRCKDGRKFPIVINGLLTKGENGKQYIWSVVQDIKEIKLKELKLKELNEEIEKQNLLLSSSNSELEQFAYVTSHDLQEPLRMITGFLTLLETKYADQLDDKARQYIHFAVDGAVRMRQIILDLLEYSKINQDISEPQNIDIEKILEETIQLLAGTITEKNASVSWDNMPCIFGQRAPIQQLFNNLISNSLKYHSPGIPPEIKITVQNLRNKWQFCISDNGIGIDPAFSERIFELFNRLHTRKDYEGTGIGLALCKRIVEKHGGEIWVDSLPEKGSKFCFTIIKT